MQTKKRGHGFPQPLDLILVAGPGFEPGTFGVGCPTVLSPICPAALAQYINICILPSCLKNPSYGSDRRSTTSGWGTRKSTRPEIKEGA